MPRPHMPYRPQTKAAVLADLATGKSPREISKERRIAVNTIKLWRAEAQLHRERPTAQQEQEILSQKIFRYVTKMLDTMTSQLDVMADPEWVKMQDAGSLALLQGTLNERLVRILAAVKPEGVPDNAGPNVDAPALTDAEYTVDEV